MRTLKKALSLVLVLAMVLSLGVSAFAVEKAADYSDYADVKNTEAVDVLTAIGVLNGNDDGTFGPEGNFTRAQAAKMICYMTLGATVAEALPAGATQFNDVPATHWAAKFIQYCANEGIILGNGDGTFGPNDVLTASAWSKMLLCALGYDAEKEGLTGTGWEINTTRLAVSKKVAEASDLAGTFNRDVAAKLAYNAVYTANTVTYGGGSYITLDPTSGTATIVTNEEGKAGSTGTTLYADVFGGKVVEGIVTVNSSNTANIKTTTVTAIGGGNTVVNLNTGADLYGRYVKVYYKDAYTSSAKPGTAYAVVDKTVEIGGFTSTNTAKEVQAKFNAAGITTDVTVSTKYQNGVTASAAANVTLGTTAGAAVAGKTYLAYNNAATNTVDVYGYAVADTVSLARVTAINTKAGYETITINDGSAIVMNNKSTDDVVNEYEGIAVGDVVTYTQFNTIYNLSKVSTVTGKVTAAVSTANKESVTVDGTAYTKGSAFTATDDIVAATTTQVAFNELVMGNEYVLYLDASGKVVAMVGAAAAEAGIMYLVDKYTISEAGNYGGSVKYYVQGVDGNGEEVTYQVTSTEYGNACTTKAAKLMYKVTTAYDPTLKTNVATLTAATTAGTVVVDNDGTSPAIAKTDKKVSGTSAYFDASTKFIFVSGSKDTLKVTVKEGVQAVDANKAVIYATKATASAANSTVKYVFVDSVASNGTAGTGYVFVASNFTTDSVVSYTDANGVARNGYMESVYIDGEKKDIMVATGSETVGFYTYEVDETNNLYTLTPASSGVYTGVSLTNYFAGLATFSYGSPATTKTDMKVSDAVVVVNTVAATDPSYAFISTDLATIAAENTDSDASNYTVAIVTDTTGTAPVVTYVYITAASLTAAD